MPLRTDADGAGLCNSMVSARTWAYVRYSAVDPQIRNAKRYAEPVSVPLERSAPEAFASSSRHRWVPLVPGVQRGSLNIAAVENPQGTQSLEVNGSNYGSLGYPPARRSVRPRSTAAGGT